jgi:hypothetical protein
MDSEFVDEYMLIYERSMDHDITIEARKDLEDQLIQLVAHHSIKAYIVERAVISPYEILIFDEIDKTLLIT